MPASPHRHSHRPIITASSSSCTPTPVQRAHTWGLVRHAYEHTHAMTRDTDPMALPPLGGRVMGSDGKLGRLLLPSHASSHLPRSVILVLARSRSFGLAAPLKQKITSQCLHIHSRDGVPNQTCARASVCSLSLSSPLPRKTNGAMARHRGERERRKQTVLARPVIDTDRARGRHMHRHSAARAHGGAPWCRWSSWPVSEAARS